jgi:formate-dependent nitrite reductase membrane component NrfD
MPPINQYVLEPHWANWLLVIEMFAAGIAAGTFFVIALLNVGANRGAGGDEDRATAARLGFVPLPLMLLVAILLVVDLGEPLRFLNIILRSPFAPERGPSPLMFNPNSPMTWGTYVIVVFGALTVIPFLDALWHRRAPRGSKAERSPLSLVEKVAHNPFGMAVCALFALAVGTYSGVLLNVTSQNVWGDTVLLGALYMVFSALSGTAVAAIVADRMGSARTAAGIRQALVWFAAIAGVLILVFVVNLAIVGRATPVIADLDQLVAPVFWLGVVGLAVAYPLLTLWRSPGPARRTQRGGSAVLAGYDLRSLAVVGTGVLLGVLAFRYVLLFSALGALQ